MDNSTFGGFSDVISPQTSLNFSLPAVTFLFTADLPIQNPHTLIARPHFTQFHKKKMVILRKLASSSCLLKIKIFLKCMLDHKVAESCNPPFGAVKKCLVWAWSEV